MTQKSLSYINTHNRDSFHFFLIIYSVYIFCGSIFSNVRFQVEPSRDLARDSGQRKLTCSLLFLLPMHRRNYRCQMKQYSISKFRFVELKLRMMIRITLSSRCATACESKYARNFFLVPGEVFSKHQWCDMDQLSIL